MDNENKFRYFICAVAGVAMIACLAKIIISDKIEYGAYGVIIGCLFVLVVVYLYVGGSAPVLVAKYGASKDKASFDLQLKPKEIGRPRLKQANVAPTIQPQESLSRPDEKKILDKFYSILQEGESTDYQRALDYLDANKTVVVNSWRLSTNFARCLAMLGRYDESEKFWNAIMSKFDAVPEAVASAHEIMVLCLDGKTPESASLKGLFLKEQLLHIEHGLKASPRRMSLLLNGFEVNVELDCIDDAIEYFGKAILADQAAAKEGLSKCLLEPTVKNGVESQPRLKSLFSDMGIL